MKFVRDYLFKLNFVSPEDFHFFKVANSVSEAVSEITQFYKNYNSSRWVGDQLVIRLTRRISTRALAELNRQFTDVIRAGEIAQGSALDQEKNEPEIWDLPRLVLRPHRHSLGRFRQLIDAINLADTQS
jgi:hypothetical protein